MFFTNVMPCHPNPLIWGLEQQKNSFFHSPCDSLSDIQDIPLSLFFYWLNMPKLSDCESLLFSRLKRRKSPTETMVCYWRITWLVMISEPIGAACPRLVRLETEAESIGKRGAIQQRGRQPTVCLAICSAICSLRTNHS